MRSEKIRVAVRARPTGTADGASAISWADDRVFVASGDAAASFRCDRFLDAAMTQEAAFVASGMATLVQSAVDGYAATIFAYGQTGAGKSYTIFGPDRYLVPPSHLRGSSQGFLPRSVALLMDCIASKLGETQCAVRVTCVEIYNESVHDLITPSARPLTVRWSKATGFFLEDATVVSCGTYEEAMTVVLTAAANRVHSSHRLNDRSNRSHCLVTLYVDSETNGVRKYGKLTIVDLAGSERAHDTGAVGTQLKESGYINKSLYCLSQARCQRTSCSHHDSLTQVIGALNAAAHNKTTFVPYRDSKLTMLLIDSLGGRSRTLMLACVNASPDFSRESTRTLEFAMGVARIHNEPTVALSPQDKLVMDLRAQIKQLQHENEYLRSLSCAPTAAVQSSRTDNLRVAASRSPSMPTIALKTERGGEHPPPDNQADDIVVARKSLSNMAIARTKDRDLMVPRSAVHSSLPSLHRAPISAKATTAKPLERVRRSRKRVSLPALDVRLEPIAAAAPWDDARAADLFQQLCQL